MELLLIICNLLSGAAWFVWAASRCVGLLRFILVACYLKLLDLSEWLHVMWAAYYCMSGVLSGAAWFMRVALYYLRLLYILWLACYLEQLDLSEWRYITWRWFILSEWFPLTQSCFILSEVASLIWSCFIFIWYVHYRSWLIWGASYYLELLHIYLICVLSELINLRGFVLSGAASCYLSDQLSRLIDFSNFILSGAVSYYLSGLHFVRALCLSAQHGLPFLIFKVEHFFKDALSLW
jgi:hypothetical protein